MKPIVAKSISIFMKQMSKEKNRKKILSFNGEILTLPDKNNQKYIEILIYLFYLKKNIN